MIIYSVIMFAVAAVFFALAAAVYRGNTNLIHDYHRKNVKEADKKEYGKSFSKGLLMVAVSLVFSGTIALFGETVPLVIASVIVLFVGMIIAFGMLVKVQTKFNGGLF